MERRGHKRAGVNCRVREEGAQVLVTREDGVGIRGLDRMCVVG